MVCGWSKAKLGDVDTELDFGYDHSFLKVKGFRLLDAEENTKDQKAKAYAFLQKYSKKELIDWILEIAVNGREG